MDELERKRPEEVLDTEKQPIIVILDDVRSMHNVGSAFRTCDAFAIEAINLCGFTPSPPHRDIHKTALGATDTVKWQHFDTTLAAVENARAAGYTILAVEQAHNSTMLHEYKRGDNKLALVFGNEVTGVTEEVLAIVDGCLEIPQWGAKHSLNISVSVGVVLWELVKPLTPKGEL